MKHIIYLSLSYLLMIVAALAVTSERCNSLSRYLFICIASVAAVLLLAAVVYD